MRALQEDNLALMKALKETNINLQTTMYAYKAFLSKLRDTMTDEEIDQLLVLHGKTNDKEAG